MREFEPYKYLRYTLLILIFQKKDQHKVAVQTAQHLGELMKKEIELLDFCNEIHAWKEFAPLNENGKKQWLFHNNKIKQLFMSFEIRQLGERWYEHPEIKDYKF